MMPSLVDKPPLEAGVLLLRRIKAERISSSIDSQALTIRS